MNTSSIDEHFGGSVRAYRNARGLSQRALAESLTRAGMPADASAVSRIEGGERSVRLPEAMAIAMALGCGLGDLLDLGKSDVLTRADAVIDLAVSELLELKSGAAL